MNPNLPSVSLQSPTANQIRGAKCNWSLALRPSISGNCKFNTKRTDLSKIQKQIKMYRILPIFLVLKFKN